MDILDYSVIAIYLVTLLAIGFRLRGQQTKQDYFLAGRSLGWKPLLLSVMATQLSAVSFISAPAFVGFREGGGLIWLSYELAIPLAMLLLLTTVLPTLYRSGVVSIYDYLEKRFSTSTRICISVVFQISRAFATGIMVYALSIILQGTMEIAPWQAIMLIGVITVLYSLQGGMKAVVYGDAVQMVVIVLGTVICIAFALFSLGGWESFIQLLPNERLTTINYSSFGFDGDGFGFLPMVLGGIVLYASYYGCDQSEAQRALSARSESDLKKMMVANGVLRFPITLLYCFAGLIVGTLAFNDPQLLSQIPKSNPDWLMPIFILNYLPHGLIGLLVVAILAAAMSSLSSAINSLSAVSLEDYFKLTHNGEKSNHNLVHAKIAGLAWGCIILLLSFNAGDIAPTVIEAVNKVGSVFFGPVLAVFLLGMLTRRVNAKQVNIALFCGVATNLTFAFFIENVFWFWWNVTGFLSTVIPAVLLAMTSKTDERRPVNHAAARRKPFHFDKAIAVLLFSYFGLLIVVCYLLPDWLR
ncbi:sodium:solute symporter family transporter [Alteromonas mediterranea]|jgi:solute carrier family 5 (sodium-coupled monocarboxylate transporter), member 8/12|uniref:sodium:solute symporter family transporter n=1 Tax=Alteromonas mediterranea TaxID=314275 RepID=UPI00241CC3ED|nr:sodium/solute symporter [Alteromonas mediterranea]|tara:strand:- start:1514 stop:3091 length:1578 start_codon:yes stop_codon:yes gene_type:complete